MAPNLREVTVTTVCTSRALLQQPALRPTGAPACGAPLRPPRASRRSAPPMARTPSMPRTADAQLDASDLDWSPRSRVVMGQAIGDALCTLDRESPVFWRLAARTKDAGPCPLETVGVDIITLANLGRSESALRAIEHGIGALIDDLFPHVARRSLDELDLLEQQLEAEENDLTLRRRIEGDTPALLLKAAEVNRAEALVQMERARVLESKARRDTAAHAGTPATTTPGRVAEATDRAFSVKPAPVQGGPSPRGKVLPEVGVINRVVREV